MHSWYLSFDAGFAICIQGAFNIKRKFIISNQIRMSDSEVDINTIAKERIAGAISYIFCIVNSTNKKVAANKPLLLYI